MINKKNILLISTIYPKVNDSKGTLVCHYFAKEWKYFGYNVRVINVQAVYPFFLYWIAKMATSKLASKLGAVIYTHPDKKSHYMLDDIPIFLYPIFKFIPHGKYQEKKVRKMVDEIIVENEKDGFEPDYILGHFLNPVLEATSMLKEKYPSAITANVVHIAIDQIKSVYGDKFDRLKANIDVWGFRSRALQNEFETKIGKIKKSFYCYSGIPESLLMDKCYKTFDGELKHFIYIGTFIARKYPKVVIEALHKSYPKGDFKMTYVGYGAEIENVKAYIRTEVLEENVSFTGKIPRDEIIKYLDDAECFAMISKNEAFGLVYLEAMARGCITIASRDEGVDGIIVDGKNGFLCKSGDINELSSIINRINALSPAERKTISEAGRATAAELTDKKVAKMYINNVERLGEKI